MQEVEIAILGLGPAGIQAGIHAGRRKHKVIAFGKPFESSLINAEVDNYFGFKEKVRGEDLIEAGLFQLKKFGVEIIEEDIVKIEPAEDGFELLTEKEKKFKALAIIVALGVKMKKQIFKEEDKLIGRGVSYCIDCDAWFYKGKSVIVVGEGSSATFGAKFLTNFAKEVYFYPLKELKDEEKEELVSKGIKILSSKPVKILGEEEVKGILLEDGSEINLDGVFIEVGAKGSMELLAPLGVELDPESFTYIKVDREMKTSVEGIFACGDITGPPFQLAKAVGEGCIAGLSASEYIKSKKGG